MLNGIRQSNQDVANNAQLARREALKLAGALGAGLAGIALTSCNWADAQNADHAGHEGHAATGPAKYQDLIDAAMMCVNRGEVCIDHCAKLLGTGDTSLKDCMNSVAAMLPMCTAVARFAAFDAPRLKEVTKLCVDICTDCEKECRKHEQHHVQCKNCADSCAAFIREGRKVIGA
jgi:Cys-rich four helix bundle protein (predicted Tat secretion target)